MNLIICTSPFQMLLAEKIIELNKNEKFYIIVFSPLKNDKYIYYSNRLKEKANKGITLLDFSPSKRISFIAKLIYIRCVGFLLPAFNKVYIASIDSIAIHLLLTSLKRGFNIYTFDDGTANIDKNSLFYRKENFTKKMKLISLLLCCKFNMDKLKMLSKEHITIYKEKSNIIDKTKLINLFNKPNDSMSLGGKTIRFLIGQSVYILMNGNLSMEDVERRNKDIINSVIEKYHINYYFPHPKESYHIDNIKYVNTKLIFEDYFLDNYSTENNYEIYTFFSGAVLPFLVISNVKVISIKPDDLTDNYTEIYTLMKEFGAVIIPFNVKER